MYRLLRTFLFLLSAERAHKLTLHGLGFWGRFGWFRGLLRSWCATPSEDLSTTVAGLRFPNPIGLAAGLDKDAEAMHGFAACGFGFLEIGTVTPKPQAGNPQPRLFRLKKDRALLNRMGFNNAGMEVAFRRLQRRPKGVIVGANIGKNKATPNQEAVRDYLLCLEALHGVCDYFTINVSSPNTPGLRELQDADSLKQLLEQLVARNNSKQQPKPLFLKIAPDMAPEAAVQIADLATDLGLQGLIVSNTTVSRQGLTTEAAEVERLGAGGISGAPLRQTSTALLATVAQHSQGKLALIASGGVMSPQDVLEKLDAGADLVQVYSGLVYAGPALVKKSLRALALRQR